MTDLTYDASPMAAHREVSRVRATVTERPGDDAFVTLFKAHFERLRRYLNRLCGDAELASELAQDAFVRLYRRTSPPDDPEAWLFTVGTNLMRNASSKRSRRARLLTTHRGRAAHSDPPATPADATEAVEVRSQVRSAVDRLTERERSLLMLFAEGYSYREIATVLGLNEASVGTLLRRAKEAFRTAFEEGHDAS